MGEYSEKASFGLTLSKKIPITKAIRDKGENGYPIHWICTVNCTALKKQIDILD